jgi:hypothetical protein
MVQNIITMNNSIQTPVTGGHENKRHISGNMTAMMNEIVIRDLMASNGVRSVWLR